LLHDASTGQIFLWEECGKPVSCLAAFFLFSQELSVAQDSAECPIRPVTIIDVTTGAERKEQTVRIQGTRIASIATTQEADTALPNSLDAHGGFLITGLWDMHVHVHDVNELPLCIANRVTGIRIMSGDKDSTAYHAELSRR
jgi:hypothetical protein